MRDGWVEATLSDVLEPISNRPNGKDYPLVLSVTEKRGIIPQTEIFNHRIATDDISKYKVLEPMDIAYNPYLLWCGAIGQWQGTEAGVVSPVYECFRVKSNCEPRYLGYVFETGILTKYFDALAIGSIVRRRRTIPSDFIAAPIQLPPLAEQKRIVDFISSVDSYIAALEGQLESGNISRNAVLHELLTTGGDDWVETTLGDISKCAGGCAFPDAFQGNQEGIPFIKVSDMNSEGNEKYIRSANNYVSAEVVSQLRLRIWDQGTIIFPKVGAALLTEKRRILTSKTIFDNNIMGLVSNGKVSPEFLYLLMYKIRFSDYVQPGAVPSIKNSIVEAIEVSIPSISEQERIVSVISELDSFLNYTLEAIARAKNLRSGLLFDLLNGENEIPTSYDKVMGAA